VLLEHVGEHIENLRNMLTNPLKLDRNSLGTTKIQYAAFKKWNTHCLKKTKCPLVSFFGDAPQIDEKIC
jgi:hypothetical protein